MMADRPEQPESNATFRQTTGVLGLDDVLGGGLPSDRLYVVEGEPGSGKTTFALQFLREGVRRGQRTLYITLSETLAELSDVAASHGWTLEGINLIGLNTLSEQLEEEANYGLPSFRRRIGRDYQAHSGGN
jgi:circadian clock protein KaiC